MIDSLTWSVIISILPALAILALFFLKNRHNEDMEHKKELYFLLGFLSITLFYIVSPDPLFISKFYISEGDFWTPIWLAIIGTLLLAFAIFYFRRHEEA